MATKLGTWNDALRFLGAQPLQTMTDNVPSRYVLEDAYDGVVEFVASHSPWRFAITTAGGAPDGGTPPTIAGFTERHTIDADSLRVVQIFRTVSAKEYPVDCRQERVYIYSNEPTLSYRFISKTTATTEANWPEVFAKSVASRLAFEITQRITQYSGRAGDMLSLWETTLQTAQERAAIYEDPWLPFQLDGSFRAAVDTVLGAEYWRFAMTQVTLSSAGAATIPGFSHRFTKPSDYIRPHAIFTLTADNYERPLDVREDDNEFSAAVSSIHLRYVSRTQGETASLWPGPFREAVAAYLGIRERVVVDSQNGQTALSWPDVVAVAGARYALQPDSWLSFQLDGSFRKGVDYLLEDGQWGFGITTVEIDHNDPAGLIGSFQYDFDKPEDWFSTVRVFRIESNEELDIYYQDEVGKIFADYTPIYMRYVSTTLGRDTSRWRQFFDEALLAWLQLRRALEDPRVSGAQLQRRRDEYERLKHDAKMLTDHRERPRIKRYPGRFTSARAGGFRFGRGEQG